MGVRVFRNDNWNRITNGVISRKDIMRLDAEKDRELIRYLLVHAPEPCRQSMMKYAAEQYGIEELIQPRQNSDDPNDADYERYLVLREQVVREDDYDVLKEAALHSPDHDMAAFAFCRLTGYRFPPDDCDAYSYRTFSCDILPGLTAESIREFCLIMIEERGMLADVAEKCLCHQKTDHR